MLSRITFNINKHARRCWLLIAVNCLLVSCQNNHEPVIDGYIEGELTYISSIVPGYLNELAVSRGDKINVGQLLYQLEPFPEKGDVDSAQAQLESAKERFADLSIGQRETIIKKLQAELAQAKAQLNLAAITLSRTQKLVQKQVQSKADLDAAKTDHQAQQQRVDALRADLEEAMLGARQHQLAEQQASVARDQAILEKQQWLLSQKQAHALAEGVVFDTFYHVGEFIPAGQPIAALLTKDNIKVIFFVPEKLLARIDFGDKVKFSCDSCAADAEATINYIANVAEYTPPIIYDGRTREKLIFRVEAKIAAEKALNYHAGQPVEIRLNSVERSKPDEAKL